MADVEVKIERTAWGGDLQPCAFSERDVADKLGIIAALKPGDPFPTECEPNNWGSIISHVCAEAKAEIEFLQNATKKIERLIQLHANIAHIIEVSTISANEIAKFMATTEIKNAAKLPLPYL